MPTTDQILAGLTSISNNWQMLAIVWHVYFAVLAGALLLGMRPPRRVTGVLLALPLFSVSALAWMAGNPFNGTLFALFGIALVVIALRLPVEEVTIAPTWLATIGVLMFVFGWVYPHFLATATFWPYLYAAPTGLVPCPTLSIVIGMSLILGGLDSRAWVWTMGAAGLFYGVFGAMRLDVTLDFMLLVGALLLVVLPFLLHGEHRSQVLAH